MPHSSMRLQNTQKAGSGFAHAVPRQFIFMMCWFKLRLILFYVAKTFYILYVLSLFGHV